MKAWEITADEMLRHDCAKAIHERIQRVWLHNRCATWVMWRPPHSLLLLRADDVYRSKAAQRTEFLVGVYTERVTLAHLIEDIRHHVQEHRDGHCMG